MKNPVQGLELIQHLAQAEQALAERIEQARESARHTIASAEQAHRLILAEAEAQIRQMEAASRIKMEMRCSALVAQTRKKADEAADGLRRQAAAKMDRAVQFLLSRVMP